MKLKIISISISALLALSGCGSSNSSSSAGVDKNITADLIITTAFGSAQGFLNMVDGSKTSITSERGIEQAPISGTFTHDGFVYTTGGLQNDKIKKYSVQSGNVLKFEKELVVSNSGSSTPTALIFENDKKAYLSLAGDGELLEINLEDFSVKQRIDLSPYAMDENIILHKDGGNDTNPEPTGGVIREGKLFMTLGQINFNGHETPGGFICRGKASVLIIDTATNTIDKHIEDNRTCGSGDFSTAKLALADNGDIYINNVASYGYDARGIRPGYLRIKNGEDEFDPNYFFNIGDLDLSGDFPDMNASLARTTYAYRELYHDNQLYVTMMVLGLTTGDPNDFIGNKNYQPYVLDMENKTATKLDMLPTNGFSAGVGKYKGEVVYPEATVDGFGLYKAGEKTPFITTDGQPLVVIEYK